ncbi:DUF6265 family protein [Ekhidna sp. To15]|uniref:DUF6265 family protein n=1 Tax=Ekhidna sp. To15 TaxID=3395267 RepID=UPI003F528082
MKKALFLGLSLFASLFAVGQSINDFKWLKGTWQRQNVRPGNSAFEVWEETKKGFVGTGVSMTGTDTTFVEKLSIVEKDSELYYVAFVSSNGAPTYFKITSVSENGFVSENPQHDFPKKIEYTLEGAKLTAVISAGEKAMGFVFVRKE